MEMIMEIIWKVCMIMNLFLLVNWRFFGSAKKANLGWIHLIVWPVVILIGPLGTIMILGKWFGNRQLKKVF